PRAGAWPPAAAAGASPRPRAGAASAAASPRPRAGAASAAAPRPRAPAGAGSRPKAAIQMLPSPSTAMPPVDCGHTKPIPPVAHDDTTRPAESNSITDGAGTQHSVDVGGVRIIDFSDDSSESAPRWTIQT